MRLGKRAGQTKSVRCFMPVVFWMKSHLLVPLSWFLAILLTSTHSPRCEAATVRAPQQLPRRTLRRTACRWGPGSCFAPLPSDAVSSPQTTRNHFTQTASKEKTVLQRQRSLFCKSKGRRRDCRIRATLALCRWKRTSTTHSLCGNVDGRFDVLPLHLCYQ